MIALIDCVNKMDIEQIKLMDHTSTQIAELETKI